MVEERRVGEDGRDILLRNVVVDKSAEVGIMIDKEVFLTNLRETSVKTIDEYFTDLRNIKETDQPKTWRTEDFLKKEDGLNRVLVLYENLLSETSQVTADEQSLLTEHLNFILKRAIDQDLNSPENYVSHGLNHTLNVIDYIDQIIIDNPMVLTTVAEKYGITLQKAKFLLENVGLFHDFGYPESELKHMSKVAHSMTGADIINYGETEVSGKKMPIKEVLARIFGQDGEQNKKAAIDIRNSVLMHNADKFDKNYTIKLITDLGNYLVDYDDLYRACNKVDGIKNIFIYFDRGNGDIKDQGLIEGSIYDLFLGREKPNIEWTDTKYKGRKLDPKNKYDNFLGLEYFKVVLTEEPLLAIIRLADNMDMTYDRLSSIQKHPLFKACYNAVGNENSPFYKRNKRIENAFEKVELEERKSGHSENMQLLVDDLKREVAEGITVYRVYHELGYDSTKIIDEVLLNNKLMKTMFVTNTSLSELPNAQAILSYWRTFIVDRLAKPIGEIPVDTVTKSEIKKLAIRISSADFPHFSGCEPILNARINGGRIEVDVDTDLYNKLNELRIEEVIKSGDQISLLEIPAGEFQIRRLFETCKGIRLNSDEEEIPIYVNGEKYIPN